MVGKIVTLDVIGATDEITVVTFVLPTKKYKYITT